MPVSTSATPAAIEVADLPYPALLRLAAELRRQLSQVLDAIGAEADPVRPDGSARSRRDRARPVRTGGPIRRAAAIALRSLSASPG